jgi:hypothetical protein
VKPGKETTVTTQGVPVVLDWEVSEGALTLTATTPSLAASYDDRWSMSPSVALISVTVVEASSSGGMSYVSRASVSASTLAPDTTYSFSYSVVMRTSECTWVGSGSVTVTVGSDGSVVTRAGGAIHI